jgi:DNA polymerase III epsilon subunit family exonuclease
MAARKGKSATTLPVELTPEHIESLRKYWLSMPDKRTKRTLVYDTETTGLLKPQISDLKAQPKIIEFALAELDEGYNLVRTHEWLIYPGEDISAEITKITGLTNDDLRGKPSFIEVLPEIEDAMMGCDRLIAHNLPFDMGMLTNELKRVGREYAFPYPPNQMCTVQIAADVLFGRRAKLTELYEKALGEPLAQTHRALDDVLALAKIVRKMRW